MEAEVGWAPSLLLFFVVVTVDTCSIGKPSIANAPATHNPSVNQKANIIHCHQIDSEVGSSVGRAPGAHP